MAALWRGTYSMRLAARASCAVLTGCCWKTLGARTARCTAARHRCGQPGDIVLGGTTPWFWCGDWAPQRYWHSRQRGFLLRFNVFAGLPGQLNSGTHHIPSSSQPRRRSGGVSGVWPQAGIGAALIRIGGYAVIVFCAPSLDAKATKNGRLQTATVTIREPWWPLDLVYLAAPQGGSSWF